MKLLLILCLVKAALSNQCPAAMSNREVKFGSDMTFLTDSVLSAKSAVEVKAEADFAQKVGHEITSSRHCLPNGNWPVVKCEPCQPNARYLKNFFHSTCFVVNAHIQKVRTTRCSYSRCNHPCQTGHTQCLPTEWHPVWFWGWCKKSIGGWRAGLSYHYLYLPQDCTCYKNL